MSARLAEFLAFGGVVVIVAMVALVGGLVWLAWTDRRRRESVPAALTDEQIAARARAAGFYLESWMTNPPKPAMWHGTPEAMRKLIEGAA